MEVTCACVPVTALHVYHLRERAILLSGQGSTLVAHDGENQQKLFARRIFGSQVIHGISTKNEPVTGLAEPVIQVLLWAGNAAALLRIRLYKASIQENIPLELIGLHLIELADWAFFGAAALSFNKGVMNYDPELPRAILEAGKRSVLVLDSSKVGKEAVYKFCPVTRCDLIITDKGLKGSDIKKLRNLTKVLVAE